MLRVTYIGHATLLIEIGEKRLLTDPNFDPALGKFLPRIVASERIGAGKQSYERLIQNLITLANTAELRNTRL